MVHGAGQKSGSNGPDRSPIQFGTRNLPTKSLLVPTQLILKDGWCSLCMDKLVILWGLLRTPLGGYGSPVPRETLLKFEAIP